MAKDKKDRPPVGPDTEYSRKRQDKLLDTQRDGREIGRRQGFNRQQRSAELGGVIGTPGAYIQRGAQFIGDKLDDVDAYLSEKVGMEERAAFKKGIRQGLKDEGYKKGGSVKSSAPKWAKLKQLSLLWVVHQSVLTALQCVAKPVEKWSDVFNLSTNLIE
jgi:hypothetical protein